MPRNRPSPAACTIITRCYLSHARILAESYRRHEPLGRFYVVIVDDLPEGVEFGGSVQRISLEELQLPYLNELLFKYDLVEFCTAIKPTLLAMLMNRFGEEQLLYIDPDIMIARPLDELAAALKTSSIVLTPHILRPIALDGQHPSDQDILLAGAYNLGFIGLSKTTQTMDFLRWWEERLREHCRIDPATGLMTDQKWIDLVPGLFSSTTILRDDTHNVAYWNANARRIIRCGDHFLVNARPLAFFHFSNFDPEHPLRFSRDHGRGDIIKGTGLADLLELYAALQIEKGYRTSIHWKYQKAAFDNGVPISAPVRRLYLNLSASARVSFGDPFLTAEPNSLFTWATAPGSDHSHLTPFLMEVYRSRADLQGAFPDVGGVDRERFIAWAQSTGPEEMGYDPRLAVCENAESPQAVYNQPIEYTQMIEKIRRAVRRSLPADAIVAVVSKGDPQLLDLDGRTARHFPQDETGSYAGHYPSDGPAAVSHLLGHIEQGVGYFILPHTALWWLDHYAELNNHLRDNGRLIADESGVCRIYAVGAAAKIPDQTPEQAMDHLLQQRSRQVGDLLAENLRLKSRLRELELLWKSPATDTAEVKVFWRLGRDPSESAPAPDPPELLSLGDIHWLSHDATGRVISVVLPVEIESDKLEEMLQCIATQKSSDSIEVIGFAPESSASQVAILNTFGATVVKLNSSDQSTLNNTRAREFAAAQARGALVVFLDESIPPPDDLWLARIAEAMDQHPGIVAAITASPHTSRRL
jgi:hypothetical protein